MKFIFLLFRIALFFQLFRFALVGIFAAIVHFSAAVVLVSGLKLAPLIANCLAFLMAFSVSYLGHRHWSFANAATTTHRAALLRFFMVAVTGFALNQLLFYSLLTYAHWHYIGALLLVLLVVPPLTYFASKIWAFRVAVRR